MMVIIQFLFSDFWVWLGGLFYLSVIFGCLTQLRLFEINSGIRSAEVSIKGKDRADAEV